MQELRPKAVHIDFDWGELTPDGICIAVQSPRALNGTSIWVYYNESSEVFERGIAIGETLEFTVPSSAATKLPYLNTFPDLRVIGSGDGG